MKNCNDVMTKSPVCRLPTDSLAQATEVMKSGNFGSISVIENEQAQKLVGIVTDRDLAMRIVAEGRDANATKVDAAMTSRVMSCFAEDNLQEALDAMAKQKLRRILIVDQDNKIMGIITKADAATRNNQPGKTTEMVKRISQN